MEVGAGERDMKLTLVARKPYFHLPTACPTCLPVYLYLRFSETPFSLEIHSINPESDQIPFVESGSYVAYNNERGGIIKVLKEDGIIDLDSGVSGMPEWVSTKAMVESWLADVLMYELWLGSDGKSAQKIYYSDLPWPIGKILFHKQVFFVKQLLGITSQNAERREDELYRRATLAYGALSTMLGDLSFLFENRPTSLDAVFLAHALFILYALPASSVLKSKLLVHANLVTYAENLKAKYSDNGPSPTSVPQSDPSSSIPHSNSSSSSSKPGPSKWSSKPKSKPKREKTEEEKKFKRRAKYFLATQVVAVLVFLSLLSGSDDAEVDLEDDDNSYE